MSNKHFIPSSIHPLGLHKLFGYHAPFRIDIKFLPLVRYTSAERFLSELMVGLLFFYIVPLVALVSLCISALSNQLPSVEEPAHRTCQM